MDTQRLLSSPTHSAAYQDHRRQTFWQILFPVILASLVVIAVTVFLIIITSGRGSTLDTKWADISLIWLILPTLLVCLIVLALLAGLVYLMAKALGALPGLSARAQYYATVMVQITHEISDKISAPVIKGKGAWAGTREFFDRIGRLFSGKPKG